MKSLRVQLIFAILAVLGLGLGVLLLMAGSQISSVTTESYTRRQEVVTLAVANGLSEALMQWNQGRLDPQGLQQYVTGLSGQLGTDVSIVSPSGSLIATTHNPALSASNAPELTFALSHQAVASAIRDDRLYVASPIVHDSKYILGVVWTDISLSPVQGELLGRWIVLIAATAGALLLACAAGWWLSSRIVRPLASIQVVAEQMAGGRLDVRADVSHSSQELASLGEAFNHMAQQIEAMLAEQREFVANASHELRSPLAAVKLRAEALAYGAVDGERAHQYAVEIDEEMTRLGRLVSDLLQLSRIDNNAFTRPVETVNVNEELSASVRAIRPRVADKHQDLDMTIQDDIPPLYIESQDLQVMVGNLLDNAVKYTPNGGKIGLVASWERNSLKIEVTDNGEGIPPRDLPRVTERFFRVDRAHKRGTSGTGLGLALVQATAQQYDGKVIVTSNGIPGNGTRVQLVLKPVQATLLSASAV